MIDRRFVVASLLLSLGGCGGGGGGGSTVTAPVATPPPTSTPPPPPPPPPTYVKGDDFTANRVFAPLTVLKAVTDQNTPGAEQIIVQDVALRRDDSTSSIAYDTASRTFAVNLDGEAQSFGPDQLPNANATTAVYERNRRDEQSFTDTSFGVFSYRANPLYLRLAYLVSNSGKAGEAYSREIRSIAIIGSRTVASDIPTSGKQSYGVYSNVSTDSPASGLSGGVAGLSVDFATGMISSTLYVYSGDVTTEQTFVLDATIVPGTSRFEGTLTGAALSATGTVIGDLYGPGGSEIGMLFVMGSNAHRYYGLAVATRG